MADLFDIRVVHLDGGVRVELVGELDLLAAPALQEQLRGLAYRYAADQIEIDCTRCTFMDLSALGELVQLSNRIGGPQRPALLGASALVVQALVATGTADRFVLCLDDPAMADSRR